MKPLSILILFAFLVPCNAMTRRTSDDEVVVPAGETIDDSLFAAGRTVLVEGTVNGDLIAFSRRVIVRGQVNGNIYTAARDVRINGQVDGSLVSFSRDLEFTGSASHNVYAFGQTIETAPEAMVGGDLSAFGQTVDLEGSVGRDADLFAGIGSLGGQIGRNASFRGGELDVRNAAHVNGDIRAHVSNPDDVQVASGATIGGQVMRELRETPGGAGVRNAIVFWVLWFLATYLTGFVGLMIAPGLFVTAAGAVSHSFRSFLLGLAVLVVTPFAVAFFAITVIGIPLAAIGLASYAIALYLSGLVVSLAIGQRLASRRSRALALGIGLLIVTALMLIPFWVGWIVRAVVMCLGLGGLAWGLHRIPRARGATMPVQHPLPFGA